MTCSLFKQLASFSDDTIEMRTAIDFLNNAGVMCERKTKWQLKICNLSYWPNKGTIYRDGDDSALRQRGLDTLMRLIAEIQQRVEHVQKPGALILTRPVAEEDPIPRKIIFGQLGQEHGSCRLRLIPPPSLD